MMSEIQALMAEMIRIRLKAQGRSQAWLARQAGVSRKHVNLVLNGKAAASFEMLEGWATFLGLMFIVALYDPTDKSSEVFWNNS